MSNVVLPPGVYGWDRREITWAVSDLEYPFGDAVALAFGLAAEEWASVCDISFARVDACANIVVTKAETTKIIAWSEIPSRGTASVRLWLDPERPWSAKFDRGTINLHMALLHEIGHLIGINNHLQPPNVMAQHYEHRRKPLQDGDVAEAVRRYGHRESVCREKPREGARAPSI